MVFFPLPWWHTPRCVWWSLPRDESFDSRWRNRPEWSRRPGWDCKPTTTKSLIFFMISPKLLSKVIWKFRWRRLGFRRWWLRHRSHTRKSRWDHLDERWWCIVKQSRWWNFGFNLRLCYRRRRLGLRLRWWSPKPRICMWPTRLWFLTWLWPRRFASLRR